MQSATRSENNRTKVQEQVLLPTLVDPHHIRNVSRDMSIRMSEPMRGPTNESEVSQDGEEHRPDEPEGYLSANLTLRDMSNISKPIEILNVANYKGEIERK